MIDMKLVSLIQKLLLDAEDNLYKAEIYLRGGNPDVRLSQKFAEKAIKSIEEMKNAYKNYNDSQNL